MTPELAAEDGSLEERATAILDAVDSHIPSLDGDDDAREEARDALRDLGEEANELVSDSNPKALLEALDTDEDADTQYEELSLPAAMSKSDPESVIDLRTLLRLSKLPGADDDEFIEQVEELRELRPGPPDEVEGSDSESEPESASGTSPSPSESEDADSGAESTKSAESAETAESAESPSEQESGSAAESDTADEAGPGPSEKVKQELQGRLDEFRDGIRSYRESLTEDDDESEDDAADDNSDSGMGSGSSSGKRMGTTFSTVPSRKRVGVTGTTRFSTMNPRKNKDNSE